jgi:dUTP pyrophosphatase
MALDVKIQRMANGKGLPLPSYKTDGAACFDFCAAIPDGEEVRLYPHRAEIIPLGFAMEIPKGYVLDIRARSGFALKHSIGLVNGVGTIDSDYRDEILALVICHERQHLYGHRDYNRKPLLTIRRGDRIAQGLILAAPQVTFVEGPLSESARLGGFGSTGR